MNKRVQEIARERGLPAGEVVSRLQAAGIDVTAPSSTVDEATALRVLGNGGGSARPPATPGSTRASATPGTARPAGAPRTARPTAPAGQGRTPATSGQGRTPATPPRPTATPSSAEGTPGASGERPPTRTLRRVRIDGGGGGGGRTGAGSRRVADSGPTARRVEPPATQRVEPMPDPRRGTINPAPDPRRGSGMAPPRDPRRAGMAPADPRRGSAPGAGGDPRRGSAAAGGDPRRGSAAAGGDPRRGSAAAGGDPRRGSAPAAGGDARRGSAPTGGGDARRGSAPTGGAESRSTAAPGSGARTGAQSASGRATAPGAGGRAGASGAGGRAGAQGTGGRTGAAGAGGRANAPGGGGRGAAPAGGRSGTVPSAEPQRIEAGPTQRIEPTPDPRRGAAPLPDPRRSGRRADGTRGPAAGGRAGAAPPVDDAAATQAQAGTPAPESGGDATARSQAGDGAHKRPTRDSLQGERTPGSAGGRRRVVIDSQASRRAPGGGPAPAAGQPPRRQRRGRRRRGVYDEEAESRPTVRETEPDVIRVNSGSTVKDVAEYLDVSTPEVMKKLMALGELKTLTQTLADDTIEVLASEFNKEVEIVHAEDEEVAEPAFHDEEADLIERPPVVTIMGHVDHGKTSLLDAIRETEVAAGEAGGITQHIGAYQVHTGGKTITFLDTPGHEAFTAMRARGARATDIAVIVVAADDGVKPQTQEAVDHAKEAGVPMLVAVNKIDKEGAQPDRVRAEMSALGLQPVEWGGDTEFVNVSAKTREGLQDLLDTITVMAEVEELRANPSAPASGTVIESKLDPGRGPVVTILVMRGTLEVGDALVAGAQWGRVRAMQDFMGNRVSAARPGEPVEVLGFDGVPEAGEHVRAVEHERRARQLANERASRLKAESLARRSGKRISLEDIFASGQKELNLVLKADVAGSLEAIEDEIAKLPQEEVSVNVIRRAVGAVTESDVMLAAASDAVILAFNVRPVGDARAVAEREGVEIRHYSVIYRAIEELRDAMQGMLAPEEVEETVGTVEVRQIFRASRVGTIAGSYVLDGRVSRGSKVRLVRDGTVVYDGEIASLRRFNEDVREVAAGYECGIVLRDFADVKEGDMLEAYTTRQVERELA